MDDYVFWPLAKFVYATYNGNTITIVGYLIHKKYSSGEPDYYVTLSGTQIRKTVAYNFRENK